MTPGPSPPTVARRARSVGSVNRGNQLAVLLDRFTNAKQYLGGYRDAIGHHGLADQMDSFHKDWRVHREELSKRLTKLAGSSKDAAGAYKDIDSNLADVLLQQPGA